MDKKIFEIIQGISVSSVMKAVIVLLISIVNARNTKELYDFLISIPILEWVLNKHVLIVLRQAVILLLFINSSEYIGNLYTLKRERLKSINSDIVYLEKALNNILILTILIYSLILINAILKETNVSFHSQFIVISIIILIAFIYGIIFNKWRTDYKTDLEHNENN